MERDELVRGMNVLNTNMDGWVVVVEHHYGYDENRIESALFKALCRQGHNASEQGTLPAEVFQVRGFEGIDGLGRIHAEALTESRTVEIPSYLARDAENIKQWSTDLAVGERIGRGG